MLMTWIEIVVLFVALGFVAEELTPPLSWAKFSRSGWLITGNGAAPGKMFRQCRDGASSRGSFS